MCGAHCGVLWPQPSSTSQGTRPIMRPARHAVGGAVIDSPLFNFLNRPPALSGAKGTAS
jgi:hypothetical protein